jgi:hypothetical protein
VIIKMIALGKREKEKGGGGQVGGEGRLVER